jgi:predicted alternative tryptophan synthase beta-subunit
VENRLEETVRIASIVQKGMATGRSSYVEMRALDRLTKHNIKTRVSAVKKSFKLTAEVEELLTKIPQAVSDGYTKVLTPNGIVRENELDRLLSIDAEIVTGLGMLESERSHKVTEVIEILKELVEARKKLVDSLKA